MSGSGEPPAFRRKEGDLDDSGTGEGALATLDEVLVAIDQLADADLIRLEKAAGILIGGTEYSDHRELLNEALTRTLSGAKGQPGRHWPKRVPFLIFLTNAMKSIADASRNSSAMKEEILASDLAGAHFEGVDPVELFAPATESVESQIVRVQESHARQARVDTDLAALHARFADDDEVNWIIMGIEDALSPGEIRDLSGMAKTQYETARRRFRRGLEKLFPGRSIQ